MFFPFKVVSLGLYGASPAITQPFKAFHNVTSLKLSKWQQVHAAILLDYNSDIISPSHHHKLELWEQTETHKALNLVGTEG